MQRVSTSISSLVPMQDYLDTLRVREMIREFNPDLLTPALLIPYGSQFLVAEGHKRSAMCYRLGMAIPAIVLEHDADIPADRPGVFGFWAGGPVTIEQVVARYKAEWRDDIRNQGIDSFYDLLVASRLG